MSTRNEPVTKGYVRKVAVRGGALICLLVLGLQFKGSVDAALALRAGCERGNVQREVAYNNTIRDALSRATAAGDLGDSGPAVALLAIEGFTEAQQLRNTYASVAAEPGSVQQDCDEAYRLPFPLG